MELVSDYFATAVAVCAGVLTAAGFIALITPAWRRTVGRYRTARNNIAKLAAGATVDYFTTALGTPLMRRTVKDADSASEWLWVDPLFVVQGIVDGDGTVVRWAVTIRRRQLKLQFTLPPSGEPHRSVTLGRTAFAGIDIHDISHIDTFFDARRFWYHEQFYFGNPGRYQRFWLAANDSIPDGIHPDLASVDTFANAAAEGNTWWEHEPGRSALQDYRSIQVPNTFSEAIPEHERDPYLIGPDLDHLRLVLGGQESLPWFLKLVPWKFRAHRNNSAL